MAYPIGCTIVGIRRMTQPELDAQYWTQGPHEMPPLVLELSDGSRLYASRDLEGNGPGEIFGMSGAGEPFSLAAPVAQGGAIRK